jgi:hypothetical protein
VERSNEGRVPKMLMTCGIGGRRRKCRPWTRWKAEVEEDLREIGITEWRAKTKNRDRWKNITKQAMDLLGAFSYSI